MLDIWELNFTIELWGVAFCVVGIICTLLLVRTDRSYHNLLIALFSLELFAAAGDATTIAYAGNVDSFARAMTHIGNFVTFACTFFLQAAISSYLCLRFHEAGGRSYRAWRICVYAAATVMCALTAMGVFYSYDEGNFYHRNDAAWLSFAFVAAASAVNAALVVVNRKRLGPTALVCLLVYTVAPFMASAVQAFVFGINLSIVMGVIALVVVFLELQVHSARMLVDQAEALARSEAEAANSRITVMVAQMQPHFLFNTLDTIYGLCDDDPQMAKGAIASFSRYLRANLDALNRAEPVPVEKEMDHVRTYLELERTSDPDRVAYELDLAATGFSVPALSVQTLAENAVKHGIGAKSEGGTVKVRTSESLGEFTVTVADDGVGFDAASADDADSSHVGIENTRSRLAAMCGGELEVASAPGSGTVAVMHIPKKGVEA